MCAKLHFGHFCSEHQIFWIFVRLERISSPRCSLAAYERDASPSPAKFSYSKLTKQVPNKCVLVWPPGNLGSLSTSETKVIGNEALFCRSRQPYSFTQMIQMVSQFRQIFNTRIILYLSHCYAFNSFINQELAGRVLSILQHCAAAALEVPQQQHLWSADRGLWYHVCSLTKKSWFP